MTADELRAKFEAWWIYHFRDGNGPPPSRRLSGTGIYTVEVDEILWTTWQAAYASRDAEVEALRDLILDRDATIEIREHEVEASRKDVERVNHLALHPRGAKIVIAGMPRDCIFWGVSSAPCYTLREAIDAAMRAE